MYHENVRLTKTITTNAVSKTDWTGTPAPDRGRAPDWAVPGVLIVASSNGVIVTYDLINGLSVCMRYSILSASLMQAST